MENVLQFVSRSSRSFLLSFSFALLFGAQGCKTPESGGGVVRPHPNSEKKLTVASATPNGDVPRTLSIKGAVTEKKADSNSALKDQEKTKESQSATTKPSDALLHLPKTDQQFQLDGPGVIQGSAGVVASVEAQATKVGVTILERGGNAMDAAVATAFALAVTHPSAGNIGGGGFLLSKQADQVLAVDFREDAPAALEHKSFFEMIKRGARDGAAVGVPGTVAGLYLAHQKQGSLPWNELLEPAIRLSRQGFVFGKRQAKTLMWATKQLWEDPVGREVFYQKKREARAGELIKNERLAATLELIAQAGPQAFYQGAVAEDIIASLGPEGLMTLEDLKGYEARELNPLAFDFQGRRVITMPAPSAGGVALTQILLMMDASGAMALPADSPGRYHYFLEASRRAQVERRLFIDAPERHTPAEQLALRKRWLSPQTWLEPFPIQPKSVTPSFTLTPLFHRALKEVQQTTHFSVMDARGDAVSCTVTLSGSFGIRRLTSKTGIVLNNSVASFASMGQNLPRGGVRTVSSMAPTLVLQRGQQNALLVLGSPGGDTIPSTVSQLLMHLVDGKNMKQAANAPRVHHGFVPDETKQERYKPLPDQTRIRLGKMGHRFGQSSPKMGDANLVAFVQGQGFFAVSDWREGGKAQAALQLIQ